MLLDYFQMTLTQLNWEGNSARYPMGHHHLPLGNVRCHCRRPPLHRQEARRRHREVSLLHHREVSHRRRL